MSTGQQPRTRSRRVAAVELPPGLWGSLWHDLRQGSVMLRLSLCAVTAIVLWAITRGWEPPIEYHKGDVPNRDVVAAVEFSVVDEDKTRQARIDARRNARAVFDNNPEPIDQLVARLQNDLQLIAAAEKFDDLSAETWAGFEFHDESGEPISPPAEQFAEFAALLENDGALEQIAAALDAAFAEPRRNGLLEPLPSNFDANFAEIDIRRKDGRLQPVAVETVRIDVATANILSTLRAKMAPETAADRIAHWLRAQIPITLTLDPEATRRAQEYEAQQVNEVPRVFLPGPNPANVLVHAGQPIDDDTMELLREEHQQRLATRSWGERVARSFAILGLYLALFTLCGYYIYFHRPEIIHNLSKLNTLLALIVFTVGAGMIVALWSDPWQAELVPLLIFAMTVTIVYQQLLALLMAAAMTLVFCEALGSGLGDALIMMSGAAGAVLVLGRVRSRSKLLSVGLVAAIVVFFTAIGVGTLQATPFAPLVIRGAVLALWCLIAGSLMTCLLPLVERLFGVQTDISLIELGDPAHPLLQELIRRAPGTYNHSITVASLAEAAAESIGARGLLVRVGAYFHDIGKMLKPGYFIENQQQGDNRHDSLVPAMSTLVIIAHVKDGADLARQHRLPEPIIDFIQQHHGTTLVEYFYRLASEQQEERPDEGQVDETAFRYPGPKPQTREAAVLMLSDAVESASRVLVEPTPSRIESLVEELTMKRLMDGQFDDCGLTLTEVRRVEESLVKSVIAVYHGRVKYPDQVTA